MKLEQLLAYCDCEYHEHGYANYVPRGDIVIKLEQFDDAGRDQLAFIQAINVADQAGDEQVAIVACNIEDAFTFSGDDDINVVVK